MSEARAGGKGWGASQSPVRGHREQHAGILDALAVNAAMPNLVTFVNAYGSFSFRA